MRWYATTRTLRASASVSTGRIGHLRRKLSSSPSIISNFGHKVKESAQNGPWRGTSASISSSKQNDACSWTITTGQYGPLWCSRRTTRSIRTTTPGSSCLVSAKCTGDRSLNSASAIYELTVKCPAKVHDKNSNIYHQYQRLNNY